MENMRGDGWEMSEHPLFRCERVKPRTIIDPGATFTLGLRETVGGNFLWSMLLFSTKGNWVITWAFSAPVAFEVSHSASYCTKNRFRSLKLFACNPNARDLFPCLFLGLTFTGFIAVNTIPNILLANGSVRHNDLNPYYHAQLINASP